MTSVSKTKMRYDLAELEKRYSLSDKRIYVVEYDSEYLFNKWGKLQPAPQICPIIPTMVWTQIDWIRLHKLPNMPIYLKSRIEEFLLQCDKVDGLRTDFNRLKVPKRTEYEMRWVYGIK